MAIKHELLDAYVERLIMIVGQARAKRIAFVDGYAGPWQTTGNDLSKTSFARAHEIMRGCQARLAEMGKQVAMRALFIELNKTAYQRLRCWAIEHGTDGVPVESWNKDFRESVDAVVQWLHPDEFAFVLIDPTGLAPTPTQLTRLLQRPNTEVLINVMWDFINRFRRHNNFVPTCTDFFGLGYAKQFDVDKLKLDVNRAVMDCFAARIREVGGAAGGQRYRCARFPVEYVHCESRVRYYLFFATFSDKGLIVFLEECARQLKEQKRIKILVEERETRIQDMFSDGKMELQPDTARARSQWLRLLPEVGATLTTSESLLANLAEASGSLIQDVQNAFAELASEAILTVEGVKRSRPTNPVHFHKHETIRRLK